MYKKLISVLLAVLILTSLLALPADAASYSSAFNCLKEFAMQGIYEHGSAEYGTEDFAVYRNTIKLDDNGDILIGVNYYEGTDESYAFSGAENIAPLIELVFVNRIDEDSSRYPASKTWIRFCENQRNSCTVYLEIETGIVIPGCNAWATINPATYTSTTNLTFTKYYGENYAKSAYQEYARDTLSVLLEYARKILVENGSDLQSLGFSRFDQHTVHAIDYSDSVILHQEPRCNCKGIIEYTCAICGQRIMEYLPMTPGEHNWDEGVLTDPPTCSTEGEITYTCVWCGQKKYEYLPIEPDAHVVYGGTYEQEPTCTEDGTKTGSCFHCGKMVTVSVPALGHLWDEGAVAREPGCTEDGVWQCTCVRCGETEEEAIPNLGGHIWTYTKTLTEAPETGHGTALYTCARCSETKEDLRCASVIFEDMPAEGNWAHAPIDWAYFNHITSGKTPTTFAPKDTVTRAEAMSFLWLTLGSPEPETTENPFADVKEGKYYYKPVLWAVENGITSGTSETTFGPKEPCTRAQILTFIWIVAGRPEPETTENPFADVKEDKYYYKAVLWGVENQITSGIAPDEFGTNNTCTRAQIVAFLYKAKDLMHQDPAPQPDPEPDPDPDPDPTEPTEPFEPTEPTDPTEPVPDPEEP